MPANDAAKLDCQTCGACCSSLDVLLNGAEADEFERDPRLAPLTILRCDRPGLVLRFMKRSGAIDRCVALEGPLTHCRCRIYAQRPELCREFAAGSPDCLACRAHLDELRARDDG
jgi:uncharacterized protein